MSKFVELACVQPGPLSVLKRPNTRNRLLCPVPRSKKVPFAAVLTGGSHRCATLKVRQNEGTLVQCPDATQRRVESQAVSCAINSRERLGCVLTRDYKRPAQDILRQVRRNPRFDGYWTNFPCTGLVPGFYERRLPSHIHRAPPNPQFVKKQKRTSAVPSVLSSTLLPQNAGLSLIPCSKFHF